MRRRLLIFGAAGAGGGADPLAFWQSLIAKYGGAGWACQETSGSVAAATNDALAVGRDVVIDGDFAQVGDWTEGANWTIGGGNATHAAGAVEPLSQDGIAAAGKSWQLTFTISNRTAGSVTPAIGAAGTARSTNDTFVEDIDATSADLDFTPTTDFDGNIDDVTLTQLDILADTAYPGGEMMTNGDFSAWTADDPDDFNVNEAGDPTSNVTQNPVNTCQFISDGTLAQAVQNPGKTIGKRYRYTIDVFAATAGTLRLLDGATTIENITTAGVSFGEFTATAANLTMRAIGVTNIQVNSISITEVNPANGLIVGATVGVTIGPAGLLALECDGANDYLNVNSAELNSMFTPLLGAVQAYIQPSGAGVWTDNTLRVIVARQASGDALIRLFKNTSNQLQWTYEAGGIVETITLAVTPTTPFLMTMTWDVAGVGMRAFYNGVQTGADVPIAGTWVGNFGATTTVNGARNINPDGVWSGKIALISDYRAVVSDADILDMAKVLGVA